MKRIWFSVALLASIGLPPHHVVACESVAFSPTGKHFAVGRHYGSIELRDVTTRKVLAIFTQLEKRPHLFSELNWTPQLAFSPDGKVLASASGSSLVTLWDIEQRKKTRTLPIRSVGYKLTFSPDGSLLAGIGMDSQLGPLRLTLWDVRTGKAIKSLTIKGNYRGTHSCNLRARFAQSSEVLAIETVEDGESFVRLWNTQNGKEIAKIESSSASLSPDGKYLVTRAYPDRDGLSARYEMWHATTGEKIAEFAEAHPK